MWQCFAEDSRMKFFTILLSMMMLAACTGDQAGSNQKAFSITGCVKEDKTIGEFAKLRITVKNESSMEFGCWAYIKIKKGNTIIDNSSVSYYSLRPGESQIEEAWFTKFSKHSEYDKAEVTLNWTIDSVGYSRDYVF